MHVCLYTFKRIVSHEPVIRPKQTKHLSYLLRPVEGEVVHGELLEPVRPGVELPEVVLQVDGGELLELHLGQADVLDLEAAPQGVDAAVGAQVEGVLGHEGGLASPGLAGEHRQLAAAEAAQQVVQGVEPLPLDA